MPKTQKDLEKHLIDLYDSIIKNGKTHDEALQEVSVYCYKMANYKRGLHDEKQFDYLEFSQVVTHLSKKEYANSLITIIEHWKKQADKALNPTNNSCKNIITLFANQILLSMDKKIVFDPAIGSGYL
ncbi:MAG: hypothetical protein LUG16_05885, partial [Candidatus Gastranaerophilales bacterium]|nr:hypothetical protein [Candidatus Gastranaerophilales bacterium]